MNQYNQKMDIIQIDNNNILAKRESNIEPCFSKFKANFELEKFFKQKKIEINKNNGNDKAIDKDNILEDENNLKKLKSDINKIVCDIIKQNVKNIYNKNINDIYSKKRNLNTYKENNIIKNNINDSNTINNNIKNNNYIRIDLPKKDLVKEGKEIKKMHNNHSTDKNANLINYFNDNKTKSIKKELRNSLTNNNGAHFKIKVYKNDILNFNNLNHNNNINNLLIINNKIKSAKNNVNNNIDNNNIQCKKELENIIKQKEVTHEEKKEKSNNKEKNKNDKEKNNSNKNNNIDNKNNSINKNGDQSHKKMIIRNIQRIQIKNIKLKNNPTGYNLTNICKKKLEDCYPPEQINLKRSKQKERICASPGDIVLSNKKINILKFKVGKNAPTSNRKNTERSFKKNNENENLNENDNSIITILDDKTKDLYSHGIRFSSVKKKKICDDISYNDLSQIYHSKKINKNNFLVKNYKTNVNRNNNIIEKNSFTKGPEFDKAENYFIIDRNDINKNNLKKSLSKESDSHKYLPWKLEDKNPNINKSNMKGNIIETHLNQVLYIDKKNNFENTLKNIKEYKKIKKKKKNDNQYIYNENLLQNNNNEINKNYVLEKFEREQIKNKKSKNKTINKVNNNSKENKNFVCVGYYETNKDEPISCREGGQLKRKRRILSTRVHIRGVNSSKNFNNIL